MDSKIYHGHNKWLNKRDNETLEEYHKRLDIWEDKMHMRHLAVCDALKELACELDAEIEKLKTKESQNEYQRGALDGLLLANKCLEVMKTQHEAMKSDPLLFERVFNLKTGNMELVERS